ncbi:hypothetical protein ACFPRL_22635 [Pseudoclavibacter helvolus]
MDGAGCTCARGRRHKATIPPGATRECARPRCAPGLRQEAR